MALEQSYRNGRAYDASQLQIFLSFMKTPIVGYKSIDYGTKQEKNKNWGIGTQPTSYGHGQRDATCTLGISSEEYRKIVDASPNGDILSLPLFDIIVTYNHPETDKIVTDKVKYCQFMDAMVETAQNDKEFALEFEILCAEIESGQRG
ncbi:MAG: hypothetical protein JSS79_05275 [Bacteroidetes bacterium]|nr:hypothetical protein [Bacteroidota bacterium]